MKTRFSFLHRLALAAAALLGLAAAPTGAHAAFVFTLTQVGGNVVVNGTGTINTSALSPASYSYTSAQITSSDAILFAGPTSFVNCAVDVGGGLSGPTNFGMGSGVAISGTGNLVGIDGFHGAIWVPASYTSGTLLTDSTTFTGTFASIGFTPGTYTYTWGSVANGNFDSLTVTSVVPEPSTWALLGLGLAGLGLTLRQRVACV